MSIASGQPSSAESVAIRRGVCTALFVFDIAMSIDLDHAERLLAGAGADQQRETLRPPGSLKHARKAPAYFEYKPPPLRVTLPAESLGVDGGTGAAAFKTEPTIELLVFDFGAVCVNYRIALDGRGLDSLLDLSEALLDGTPLGADARRRVEAFAAMVAQATRKLGWSSQVEDYCIYEIQEVAVDGQPSPPSSLVDLAGTSLAQILRSERAAMSREEIADALACRVSYGPDDAALIDWNGAILLDRDAEDVRAVLEFANVEQLEMRFLDDRLDEILEEAYASLGETKVGLKALFPSGSGRVRRIAQLQMDSAILFENVNNALKLIGDQYLARVYRMAGQRFHLPERDQTIERKLSTLESIYSKMNDHEAGRRTDLLEWIVIILIAAEILLGLMRL
jgi:hypothetical protein